MQTNTGFVVSFPLIAAVALLSAMTVQAQTPVTFSNKAVEIAVPYPPGKGVGLLARLVSTPPSEAGYEVVVENSSGAGGTIGARHVAGRPKDWHSLLQKKSFTAGWFGRPY